MATRIKVAAEGFAPKVLSLDATSTLQEFIIQVSAALGTDKLIQHIRFGYPVKNIQVLESDVLQSIKEHGIKSGDKVSLIFAVEQDEEKAKPATRRDAVKSGAKSTDPTELRLPVEGFNGCVRLYNIPQDNSCLFRSIAHCVFGDASQASSLRKIVAQEIEKDPETYPDAILGRPRKEYIEWIQNPQHWGGAIEIGILSKYMEVGIEVLDLDEARYESFNNYERFIIIAYNGVHYDCIVYDEDGNEKTSFSRGVKQSDAILARAIELGAYLKQTGYVTNTHKVKVKCNVCNAVVFGEREIAKHAEVTGHYDFGQCE